MSHIRRSCPFEAFIWNDVDINDRAGKVQIIRGLYRVRIMSDEHGKRSGAFIASMDIPGEPTIRLTQTQYELRGPLEAYHRRSTRPKLPLHPKELLVGAPGIHRLSKDRVPSSNSYCVWVNRIAGSPGMSIEAMKAPDLLPCSSDMIRT